MGHDLTALLATTFSSPIGPGQTVVGIMLIILAVLFWTAVVLAIRHFVRERVWPLWSRRNRGTGSGL